MPHWGHRNNCSLIVLPSTSRSLAARAAGARSPAAVVLLPIAGGQDPGVALTDEPSPVNRIGVEAPDCDLRVAECFGAGLASEQTGVELPHQLLGLPVGHLPKAHHQRFGAGDHERPAKAEDPFSRGCSAQSGLTG